MRTMIGLGHKQKRILDMLAGAAATAKELAERGASSLPDTHRVLRGLQERGLVVRGRGYLYLRREEGNLRKVCLPPVAVDTRTVARTDEVCRYLIAACVTLRPKEISAALGISAGYMSFILNEAKNAGLATNPARGLWTVTDKAKDLYGPSVPQPSELAVVEARVLGLLPEDGIKGKRTVYWGERDCDLVRKVEGGAAGILEIGHTYLVRPVEGGGCEVRLVQ